MPGIAILVVVVASLFLLVLNRIAIGRDGGIRTAPTPATATTTAATLAVALDGGCFIVAGGRLAARMVGNRRFGCGFGWCLIRWSGRRRCWNRGGRRHGRL